MSTTAKNKKRYSVTVCATGTSCNPKEEKIFCHNFCSSNVDTYLQNYRTKLLNYGWNNIQFLNTQER